MANKMSRYSKLFHVRWADCDFNRHMRHSAFYDYAAHIRVSMFTDVGLPMERLMELGLGPVLLGEESKFYKELRLNEAFTVDCEVTAMRHTGKIWQMHHRFYNDQGVLAAEITVDGSWIDIEKRKSATPAKDILDLFNSFPRAKEFVWLPEKRLSN